MIDRYGFDHSHKLRKKRATRTDSFHFFLEGRKHSHVLILKDKKCKWLKCKWLHDIVIICMQLFAPRANCCSDLRKSVVEKCSLHSRASIIINLIVLIIFKGNVSVKIGIKVSSTGLAKNIYPSHIFGGCTKYISVVKVLKDQEKSRRDSL